MKNLKLTFCNTLPSDVSSLSHVFLRVILCSMVFVVCSMSLRAADPLVAMIRTSKGDIKLELDIENAPVSVENFVKYAKDDFYDGTIFHRVIKGFMIQGGGFDEDMQKKETRAPIENESANGLENLRYTIAMARTPDPNSASSQFFINTADNGLLDRANARDGYGYAVFGKVVEGFEVVDAIEGERTGTRNRMQDVPVDTITINDVEIIEEGE